MTDVLRLLADENFNNDIVRGLRRREPTLNVTRVQDESVSGADDPTVIAWAADHACIVLTHDAKTFAKHAGERLAAGGHVAGIFVVSNRLAVRAVLDDLVLAHRTTEMADRYDVIVHLPF